MRKLPDLTGPYSRWPRELIAGELTGRIIGAFYEVYNTLGPGYLESVYSRALEHEFQLRGIGYEREYRLEVWYKGRMVGDFRVDFLVEGVVVVENKAGVQSELDHKAQTLNYLRGTRKEVALVLKFGRKPDFERVVNTAERVSEQIS